MRIMRFVVVGAVAVAVVLGGFLLLQSQSRQTRESLQLIPSPTLPPGQRPSGPEATPQDEDVDTKASFTIITNGLVRSFAFPMYHNLSPDVFIQASDPTVVHVKQRGVTWHDFFKTLPMKLTKQCLTTGTKETFCTGETGVLRFYLNGIEDKNLLDREIKDGDKARIEFSSK